MSYQLREKNIFISTRKTAFWILTFSIIGISTLSLFQLKSVGSSGSENSKQAEAAFYSPLSGRTNYISDNIFKTTKDTNYSYSNPYSAFENLSKSYQDNPENTKHLLLKIGSYMEKNRSRDQSDLLAPIPVSAEIYLDTAIKYNIPVELMLAIARSESRFGTDCFTASGANTRICKYQNVFSIGLTETSSIGFGSWKDGIEAFGKLYKKRKDRGYSDYEFLRIYNPNSDYATRIDNLSKDISIYLNS